MTDGQRIALAKPGDMAPVSSPDAREADLFRDNSPLTWEYVRERLGEQEHFDECWDAELEASESYFAEAMEQGHKVQWQAWAQGNPHCWPEDTVPPAFIHASSKEGSPTCEIMFKDSDGWRSNIKTVADLQCALHLMRWDDA